MKNAIVCMLWTMSLSISVSVGAQTDQTPELLIPVEQAILDRFSAKSNYFLRETLYFARRYRIVRINFDVLKETETIFTITPFEDLRINVRGDEIATDTSGFTFWKGTILSPRARMAPVEGAVNDEQTMKEREERLHVINLVSVYSAREIPCALQVELERGSDKPPRMSNSPSGSATPEGAAAVMKMSVRTLNGSWLLAALPAKLHIRTIDEDPRYQVIYEEDGSRALQGPQLVERAQRFAEFKRRLDEERALDRESAVTN